MQQSRTRAFQPKKDTGECFPTKLKSTYKNSGTFERKTNLPQRVTCVPLAPSHSINKLLLLLSMNHVMLPLTYIYMYIHVQVCIIKSTLFSLLPTELRRFLDVVSDLLVIPEKCFVGCCCCLP